jgi:DNA polymerase
MAEPTTLDTLRDSVIQYLRIRENLGERELVWSQQTMRALKELQRNSSAPQGRAERATEPQVKKQKHSASSVDPRVEERSATPAAAAVSFAKPAAKVPTASPTVSVGRDLSGLSKAEAMEVIHGEILSNPKLSQLFRRAQNMVFGEGSLDAQIMFIGEAPGAEEDQQGRPFVGKAGELLDKMIAAMGLQRENVYISNVVKYRPDMPEGSSGNRKPTPEECAECRPYVLRQISVIQPAVIVGLGATAMEGLLNQSRVSIARMRGNWENFEGVPLMPTFHPSYLLHNKAISEKRKVWEDLLQVMEKSGLPISEKQQRFFKGKG